MPTPTGPDTIAMAVAATIAAIPFVVIAAVNLWLIYRGSTPLTQLIEHYMRRYPWFAAGVCGFVGALAGHIFWSFGDNPSKPVGHSNLLFIALVVAVGTGILAGLLLAAIAYAAAWVIGRFRPSPSGAA